MADPTKAWDKAFSQGSKALQDRLKKVHAKNPAFQSWLTSQGYGSGESVRQASKEVRQSERSKAAKKTSLKLYGATKGTRVGGPDGSGESIRDTIVPLSMDQRAKVQAAERAAKQKAAGQVKVYSQAEIDALNRARGTAPKELSPDEKRLAARLSAIAAAAKKRSNKDEKQFDIPTMNPLNRDHDDLRDVHQSLHISRGYNEEVKMNEVTKKEAEEMLGGEVKERPKMPPGKQPAGYRYVRGLARKAMKAGLKKEEVESVEESVATAQKVMDRAKVVANTNPDPKKRFAAGGLAQKAMMRTINPTGVNTGIVRGGGNKTYRMLGKVPPYQLTKKTGVSEEVEQIDEISPGLARKAAAASQVKAIEFSDYSGLSNLHNKEGKKEANRLNRKSDKAMDYIEKRQGQKGVDKVNRMVTRVVGEEVEQVVEQDDSMEKKEMAQTQLHFMAYAAKEILEFIDMGGEIEEWYQNKLSKVQSEVESLHSYIEGEKRRLGMVKEESEQVDEKINLVKAKMGDVIKDFQKSDAPQFKGKSAEERRKMALAAKLGAEREAGMREEVEQVEEGAKDWKKAFQKVAAKNYEKDIAAVRSSAHRLDKATQSFPAKPDTKPTDSNIEYIKQKARKGVTKPHPMQEEEAEGKVAVTPKEKDLAAHHGDPKRITRGDVIKARLKSAASKKMGKE